MHGDRGRARCSVARRAGRRHAQPRRRAPAQQDDAHLRAHREGQGGPRASASRCGVDYIALSFVRRADDIRLVREICQAWGQPTPIIAKIETPDAIENLESIVAASDGVMVARGDLGVEFPPERVPVIQRQILRRRAARAAPGHRRDRDAPVDDQGDAAHARRGERRRQRRLLGDRRAHALAARPRPATTRRSPRR